jgi:hypothetical protein
VSFPLGVLCLFLGGLFVWVGSHGTTAVSPWALFQQVIAGFNGTPANATRPADPWDEVGAAVASAVAAGGAAAADAAGATGASLSHRTGGSSSRPASLDDTIAAGQKIVDSPDTTRADQAAAAAAQRRLDQIDRDLNQGNVPQWP